MANSGKIPGTDPRAANPDMNVRTTSGYLYGKEHPDLSRWTSPVVSQLHNPNSAFNTYWPPAVLNPFKDETPNLDQAALRGIEAGRAEAQNAPYAGIGTPPNSGPQPPGSQRETSVGPITPETTPNPSNAPWVDPNQPYQPYGSVQSGKPSGSPPTSNGGQKTEDRYPPYTGTPTVPALGDNMPTGQNYPDLVPDPGGTASNTETPPPAAPYDFGPGSDQYAPYNPVRPPPEYDASRAGPNESWDPTLQAIYSNTSGAGTSALNTSEAMSHPSFSQYYQDYLRSQGR